MPVTPPARAPIREAARAFGVVFGPSLVLDATAGAALATALRSLRRHRRPSRPVALASGLVAAYLTVGRPLMLHWGATCEELASRSPATTSCRTRDPVHPRGDDRGAGRGRLALARADRTGPRRLLQLRMAREPRRLRDAQRRRIHPEWQQREPGETVFLHPLRPAGPALRAGRVFALENWGTFVLEPNGDGDSRLIVRGRKPRGSRARERAADRDPALRHGAQDAARHQGARRAGPRPPRSVARCSPRRSRWQCMPELLQSGAARRPIRVRL